MRRSLMLTFACLLVPAGTLAAPTDQVRALRQQVAALQLDHALNLTQQQAQALLPLLQDLQGKVAALKAQRAAAEPALVAALTQAVRISRRAAPSRTPPSRRSRQRGVGHAEPCART